MLYRKAYDKLKMWKQQKSRTALCIQGARQIGKTTVVREFGKMNINAFLNSTSSPIRMQGECSMEISMRIPLLKGCRHWRGNH